MRGGSTRGQIQLIKRAKEIDITWWESVTDSDGHHFIRDTVLRLPQPPAYRHRHPWPIWSNPILGDPIRSGIHLPCQFIPLVLRLATMYSLTRVYICSFTYINVFLFSCRIFRVFFISTQILLTYFSISTPTYRAECVNVNGGITSSMWDLHKPTWKDRG